MVRLNKKINRVTNILYYTICFLVLFLSVRGVAGNPTENELNSLRWQENGPFELSPDRGRFALTYSFIENNSFNFSLNLAEFATPDLGYLNGRYVSLFDPGLSFLVMPGYIIGKIFGVAQVGAFATICVFAILNVFLIRKLAQKLGANEITAALAGLIFLFATPAFAYSVTLYQHQITTFIILFSIYLLISYDNFWSLALVWMLLGVSFLIDYPNIILVLPIIALGLKKIFSVKIDNKKIVFKVKGIYLLSFLTILLPAGFLLWFNKNSYNNYFQLASTITQITSLGGHISSNQTTGFLDNFFYTRNLLNGFYILFLSPDRGILYYSPIVFLGIGGIIIAYKKFLKILSYLMLIVGLNILLYAMWGDPWGGWAFGSRYLVPTYAILSIFLAIFLTSYKKYLIVLPIFLFLFGYSVFINTAGAITTNAIPPQIEVLNLEKISKTVQKYTYQKNFDLLGLDRSKSFVYQLVGKKYVNSWRYFYIIYTLIMSLTVGLSIAPYQKLFRNKISKIFNPIFKRMPAININFLKRKYE